LQALLGLPLATQPRKAREDLDFPAFTRACEELAAEYVTEDRRRPESLLLALAEAASRLDADSVPRPTLGAFGGYQPKGGFGPVHRAQGLMVIEWSLDPNARLPAHNHTPVNVLSICLEGECWVEHFEIEGDAPAAGQEGEFLLHRTRAQLLRAGHGTSLTPQRDNIHTFRAGPRGALGIDINVSLPGEGDWSMIAHEARSEALDALHKARWIGKPK
jgi:hypothetical protein